LQRVLLRYGLAVAMVAAVALLRLMLQPLLKRELPFLLQFVAVIVAAAFGGLGPGIMVTILGAILGQYLFVAAPGEGFGAAGPLQALENSPELRRFVIEGALISALGAWLHHARRRAQAADLAREALEKQMVEIGDLERRRLGHDLHDGIGQQLTGIALLSESLTHRLASQQLTLHAEQAERITDLVSETIGWTRELARGLSPLTLETEGLAVALENLADGASRLFGIDCSFECDEPTLPVANSSVIHVYRIIQEATSNSVKHGKAKHVYIRVAVRRGEVVFTVEDDGSGLSAKTIAQPGIGLQIMQYRAKLIGAKLAVARATPGGGTIVSCSLPAEATPTTAAAPADAASTAGQPTASAASTPSTASTLAAVIAARGSDSHGQSQ
jgi:signal transduction histidine kinase